MLNSSIFTNKLSENFSRFDFKKWITGKNRLLLHLLMWFGFATLLFLSYRIAYQLTLFNALILTLRMCISSMVIFYTFFYVLLPILLKQNVGTILAVLLLLFPVLVAVWLWVTYGFSVLYNALGYEIEAGELKGAIAASAQQGFWGAVSPSRILSQSIIFISILSPFFFVKILVEITQVYSKSLHVEKENSELQIQNVNMERDFLKAQLNPHFLFNTLNNLYGLSIKKDDKMPEIIVNLSDTMSYTLYESNAERVPLFKEVEFIRNYVELEKMRYSDSKKIHVDLPSEHECNGKLIAPLLSFTLIENAFKYGLKSREGGFLNLKVEINDNKVSFKIENDCKEQQHSNILGGIGLENLKKRLQLIYPNQHHLTINQSENQFLVHLDINL